LACVGCIGAIIGQFDVEAARFWCSDPNSLGVFCLPLELDGFVDCAFAESVSLLIGARLDDDALVEECLFEDSLADDGPDKVRVFFADVPTFLCPTGDGCGDLALNAGFRSVSLTFTAEDIPGDVTGRWGAGVVRCFGLCVGVVVDFDVFCALVVTFGGFDGDAGSPRILL